MTGSLVYMQTFEYPWPVLFSSDPDPSGTLTYLSTEET